MSFDIECAGRKGIFPEAQIDPVIQIASMVTRHGENKPFIRNVFTLNTCAHIVGSQVLEFKDERDLLMEWSKFIEEADPDMIIGYNSANFDLPYLLDRAKALKIPNFAFLGRVLGESSAYVVLTNQECALKCETPTSPRKLSDNETLKPSTSTGDCKWTSCKSSNVTTNCEVIL